MIENIDFKELERFEAAAKRWWDLDGEYKALHQINGLRCRYIENCCDGMIGKSVVDLGCGGGILSEAMAVRGARVTGVDMGTAAIAVARRHARDNGLDIGYHVATAESAARWWPGRFNVVTCLELLEHVPDPESVIRAGAELLKPGGHLIVATLNRTVRSYCLAIVAAERLLRIVPPGTHDWHRFMTPEEIRGWGMQSGLETKNVSGMRYVPFFGIRRLCRSPAVNYLMHLEKPMMTPPSRPVPKPGGETPA